MENFMIREYKDGIHRGVASGARVWSADEKSRVVEFVASDGSVDSYKTVLPVAKWDLRRFNTNPIISYQHQIYDGANPDNVIGKGRAFVEGGQLRVQICFETPDINPKADKIFRKIQFGSLNAVSVGFRPTRAGHWGDKTKGERSDVFYYDGQDLLEVSVVNIPSNANAVKSDAALASAKEEAGKVLAEHKRRHLDLDDMRRKASHLLNESNK